VGVDHVQFCITGACQFGGFTQNSVDAVFVLLHRLKGVDGGNDLARQSVVQMTDKMQGHRAFTQQVDIQRRKHQA